MSELTELEQSADREARHGHRELVKRLEARVAELEAEMRFWMVTYDSAWNAAIRAAVDRLKRHKSPGWIAVHHLLRNEGGSDEV